MTREVASIALGNCNNYTLATDSVNVIHFTEQAISWGFFSYGHSLLAENVVPSYDGFGWCYGGSGPQGIFLCK